MRALALRTTIATMVTAGMLLGGAGMASATGSGSPTTTTSSPGAPTTTTSAPTTTTAAPTTTTAAPTTTTAAPTTTTSAPTTTTSAPTTTTSVPTTTGGGSTPPTSTHPGQSPGTASAQVGCLGEVSVVVSGTELTEGTLVDVQLVVGEDTVTVTSEVIRGRVAVIASPDALEGVDRIEVLVQEQGSDAVLTYDVAVQPLTDVCDAQGGIALARDCATPDTVLATVEATGLTAGGTYGISVVGTSPAGQQVELGSADVVSADGTLAGTLPLVSANGAVPLDGFAGLALLVDGQVFASVGAADVEVDTCVVAQPLPVAPAHPAPSTTPAAAVHLAQPAALARTGTETSGLLLLAGLLLGLGGLTTLVARRAAR